MRKQLIFVLCILALSVLLSCSFFDPRDPADPDPGGEIPWQQPYSPATVVINFESAMEGRSVAMTMACCDSSYMFIADGSDTTEFASSWNFSGWDYGVEQNTMMNIFNAAEGDTLPEDSLISVTMNTISSLPDPVAPVDSALIYRDYEIIAAGSEYCGWDNPAKGQVLFLMVEDDYGLWSMKRWYDNRSYPHIPEFYTWGVVKAAVR
ncbi:hypothetical protein DRQ25_01855 [Candidatus Fermentibacteria bacterium]|nr:MAG: hypothetical protein DRQ25_01855 [Candidatus Fermentibacteria bacterium]